MCLLIYKLFLYSVTVLTYATIKFIAVFLPPRKMHLIISEIQLQLVKMNDLSLSVTFFTTTTKETKMKWSSIN